MYPVKLIASAKYLPEFTVTNDDLSKFLDTSDEWISSRTGIKERRISKSENTSALCANVLNQLIEKSGITRDEIGLIIVSTITPDSLLPSTACIVQGIVGVKNAFAFDINVACSGFVYALSIAEKYVSAGVCKYAAVLSGETLSKITDWNDRATCVLFGDGAGGVILAADEKMEKSCYIAENLFADGANGESMYGADLPIRNAFVQANEQQNPYIKMDGRAVLDFVSKRVPKSINELLEKAGATIDEIKYIVPHQANARIVEILAKKLRVGMDRFFVNINKYGNTSSATIPIAFTEMLDEGLIRLGSREKIIFTGFGAGLTWGAVLLEI